MQKSHFSSGRVHLCLRENSCEKKYFWENFCEKIYFLENLWEKNSFHKNVPYVSHVVVKFCLLCNKLKKKSDICQLSQRWEFFENFCYFRYFR
jgi:hypothetical protein